MAKGSAPGIIDAKYRVVRRARWARRLPATPTGGRDRFGALTVLIVAINTSLAVHLLMKHLLNWG